MCILNGRFFTTHDNFTSISSRGMSVVDYILAPIKSYNSLSNFRVHNPLQIITQNRIETDSSTPDHRILSVDFNLDLLSFSRKASKPTISLIKRMPNDFMTYPKDAQRLKELANMLEPNASTDTIDRVYKEFCRVIDSRLDSKHTGKGSHTNKKAWWNDDLGNLSKEVRRALRQWECNKSDETLKSAYLEKQKRFSKRVRSAKRKFRQARNNKLIEQQKRNPRDFWKFIKNLGGGNNTNLPDIV